MPIRLYIVDPLEVTRVGIRTACAAQSEFEVVGEAEGAEQARQAIQERAPDVVIYGCGTFNDSLLRDIELVCRAAEETQVLVFSALDLASFATSCLQAGAKGFLVKSARLEDLLTAIRALAEGRIFVSHSIDNQHQMAAPHFAVGPASLQPSSLSKDTLSQREREVITMVANGFTNRQIAERLFLSIKTVETYRARVMRKHSLSDRAAVMQFARKHGLTEQVLS